MFRPIKLLLCVSAICGVLSLVVFYLYTAHYNTRIFSIFKISASTTRKVHFTEEKGSPSRVKTLPGENIHLATHSETVATISKPVAVSPLPVITKKFVHSGVNGGDTIKNTKRSYTDVDETGTSRFQDNVVKLGTPIKLSTAIRTTINLSDVKTSKMPTTAKTKEVLEEESTPISSTDNEDQDIELCPEKPPSLTGTLFVNQHVPKMEDLEKHFSEDLGGWVRKGGSWKPTHCKARAKVALIIPFRKRYEQLAIFVRHMHPMLKRQEIDYRIIVVEQSGDTPFNRAILFNIGYKEALKFQNFNCFIFHDVDLIPEDDRNMYTCPTSPRHLSVAIDKFNYRLPYHTIFGGAGSFKRKDFEEINGFSNMFWGWGGEDDDLYQRVVSKGHHLSRPSLQIGRYKMIRIHHHQSSAADPNRHRLLQTSVNRMAEDGLNSLKYELLKAEERCLYTLIRVHVDKTMFT